MKLKGNKSDSVRLSIISKYMDNQIKYLIKYQIACATHAPGPRCDSLIRLSSLKQHFTTLQSTKPYKKKAGIL